MTSPPPAPTLSPAGESFAPSNSRSIERIRNRFTTTRCHRILAYRPRKCWQPCATDVKSFFARIPGDFECALRSVRIQPGPSPASYAFRPAANSLRAEGTHRSPNLCTPVRTPEVPRLRAAPRLTRRCASAAVGSLPQESRIAMATQGLLTVRIPGFPLLPSDLPGHAVDRSRGQVVAPRGTSQSSPRIL
jgi:hypothetical protein